jgi:lipopolysaccharide export system permease protein
MTKITRYIFRQLLLGTVVVSGALACIVWLTQSLRFLQYVVNKGLEVGAWLRLTMYLVPSFLVVVIPPALFFVILFVYNRLILDRELVVAQAAGVSRIGLARPALMAAALCAGVCAALTLVIVPGAMQGFRELQWAIRNDVSQILLREGAFNQITPELTVYIRTRGTGGDLQGIMVHDRRKPQTPTTLLAERGVVSAGERGPQVLLINGSRQELNPDGSRMAVLYFDTYTVDFGSVGGTAGGNRRADYRERSLGELFGLDTTDGFTDREISQMRAEGHQRLITPLTCFGFALAGLAFLLTGPFDRQGQSKRIAGAVAVLVALEAAGLAAVDAAGRTPQLVPVMYAVGLLPIAIALYIIALPVTRVPAGRRGGDLRAAST